MHNIINRNSVTSEIETQSQYMLYKLLSTVDGNSVRRVTKQDHRSLALHSTHRDSLTSAQLTHWVNIPLSSPRTLWVLLAHCDPLTSIHSSLKR